MMHYGNELKNPYSQELFSKEIIDAFQRRVVRAEQRELDALGDALAARGDGVRAQRCYRRAAAVDVAKDFRDLLRHHRLRAS
jgi:hypothetical protein